MLSARLRDIKPSLLLFLRKLRCVTIKGPIGAQGRIVTVEIHREDVNEDVVNLRRVEDARSSIESYLLVTKTVKTYDEEERRKGVTESQIVLAFPVSQAGAPQASTQYVHAFLPLKRHGFKARSCIA